MHVCVQIPGTTFHVVSLIASNVFRRLHLSPAWNSTSRLSYFHVHLLSTGLTSVRHHTGVFFNVGSRDQSQDSLYWVSYLSHTMSTSFRTRSLGMKTLPTTKCKVHLQDCKTDLVPTEQCLPMSPAHSLCFVYPNFSVNTAPLCVDFSGLVCCIPYCQYFVFMTQSQLFPQQKFMYLFDVIQFLKSFRISLLLIWLL